MATNEFGYKSLHYILSLTDDRCKLTEYKKFTGLKFEIQIRSILQYAWAEIEHDMGYKSEISIPEPLKRNFNRLAALLEIADNEFDKLKRDFKDYVLTAAQLIKSAPQDVEINSVTIDLLTNNNNILVASTKILLDISKYKLHEDTDYDSLKLVLNYFNIQNIDQIETILREEEIYYLNFINIFAKLFNRKAISQSYYPKTISLIYLAHYLAGKSQDTEFIDGYFKRFYNTSYSLTPENFIDSYIKSRENDSHNV